MQRDNVIMQIMDNGVSDNDNGVRRIMIMGSDNDNGDNGCDNVIMGSVYNDNVIMIMDNG